MKLDRLMLFVYMLHWDHWLDVCILEQLSSQFCTRSSCKSIVTYGNFTDFELSDAESLQGI